MNKIIKKILSFFYRLLFLSDEEVMKNKFPLIVTVKSFVIKVIRQNEIVTLQSETNIDILSNRYFNILINNSVLCIKSPNYKDVLKYPPIIIKNSTQFIVPEGQNCSIKLNFEKTVSEMQENILNDRQASISLQLIHTRMKDVFYTLYAIPMYKEHIDENMIMANVIIKESSGEDYILNIPTSKYIANSENIKQPNQEIMNDIVKK